MKKPKSLIIKLKGVGSWRLRKKRMQIVVQEYPYRLNEKTREQFSSDSEYNKYLDKKEQYLIFLDRLKEYDEYIRVRNETRKIRHENQVLSEFDKGQNQSSESSQTGPQAHLGSPTELD